MVSTNITPSASAGGPGRTSVRNRMLVIAAVVAVSLWAIYPPRNNIKLGLDLKGGVQLVLEVKTDQALQRETHATAERLKSALTGRGIAFSGLEVIGPAEFRVDGVYDLAAFQSAAAATETAFEPTFQDGTHRFRMRPAVARDLANAPVEQARHTIDRRVNELGVAESVVARYTASLTWIGRSRSSNRRRSSG